MKRTILAVFVWSLSVYGQTASVPDATAKILLQEPAGDPTEAKVTLFVMPVPTGGMLGSHTKGGAAFMVVLNGNLEDQTKQIYGAGDVFVARPAREAAALQSTSQTEPASVLILQFGKPETLPPGVTPLIQAPLPPVANREARVNTLTLPPGWIGKGAHQHPGQVFAYIARGAVESQVDPDAPGIFRAGEAFYEPPRNTHRRFRNLSTTEPAELLMFQVSEHGGFTAMPVQ